MENYINQFIALVDGIKIVLLMVLITGNFISGLAVSIYTGTFRLKMVADFMVSRVLPYILAYIAVGIVACIEASFEAYVTAIWGIISLALIGAILTNLKELGINLPDILAGPSP